MHLHWDSFWHKTVDTFDCLLGRTTVHMQLATLLASDYETYTTMRPRPASKRWYRLRLSRTMAGIRWTLVVLLLGLWVCSGADMASRVWGCMRMQEQTGNAIGLTKVDELKLSCRRIFSRRVDQGPPSALARWALFVNKQISSNHARGKANPALQHQGRLKLGHSNTTPKNNCQP